MDAERRGELAGKPFKPLLILPDDKAACDIEP